MKKFGIAICALATLGLAACSGSEESSGGDEGIMLADGGTPPAADPVGGECVTEQVPAYTGVGCALETGQCLQTAADGAAVTACINGDPNPAECELCLNQNLISCTNGLGCQAAWDDYVCCIDTNCPEDASCADTTCGTQLNAFLDCTDRVAGMGECGPNLMQCFGAGG